MKSEGKKRVKALDLMDFGVEFSEVLEFSECSKHAGRVPNEKTWHRLSDLNDKAQKLDGDYLSQKIVKSEIIKINKNILIKND